MFGAGDGASRDRTQANISASRWYDLASRTAGHPSPVWSPARASSDADARLGAPRRGPRPVALTATAFPHTARLKNETGLPWGAVLTPWAADLWGNDQGLQVSATDGIGGTEFHDITASSSAITASTDSTAARHLALTRSVNARRLQPCASCGALISSSCVRQRQNWQCALCENWNEIPTRMFVRARRSGGGSGGRPELHRPWGEYLVGEGDSRQIIAHVLLLDVSASAAGMTATATAEQNRGPTSSLSGTGESYFEAARRGIRDAVAELSDDAWVALVCVDTTSLGVCNLASATPHMLRTRIVPDSDGGSLCVLVPLADVLQTHQLAVRVGDHRANILAAVDALAAGGLSGGAHEDGNHGSKNPAVHFGPALAALLELVCRAPQPADSAHRGDPSVSQLIVAARVSVVALGPQFPSWLCRPPAAASSSGGAFGAERRALAAFATEAARAGVCIDVYAANPAVAAGAASVMGALALTTGGRFRPYGAASPLALDLATHFGAGYAAAGMLTLQPSTGLRVAAASAWDGGVSVGLVESAAAAAAAAAAVAAAADEDGDEIISSVSQPPPPAQVGIAVRLAGCDGTTSVAVSFDMDTDAPRGGVLGTASVELRKPVLQMQFEFLQQEGAQVVRRLRVVTLRVGVAHNEADLFECANPDVTFLVLARKVLAVASAGSLRAVASGGSGGVGGAVVRNTAVARIHGGGGEAEAAELLFDWLVYAVAQYQRHVVNGGHAGSKGQHIDAFRSINFSGCHLAPLVQLVFGLSQAEVLDDVHVSTVTRATLRCVFAGLSTSELLRAVYPLVVVYDEDGRIEPLPEKVPSGATGMGPSGFYPLSSAALGPQDVLTGGQAWTVVVDALTRVVVRRPPAAETADGTGEQKRGRMVMGGIRSSAGPKVVDPVSMLAAHLGRRGRSASQHPILQIVAEDDAMRAPMLLSLMIDDAVAGRVTAQTFHQFRALVMEEAGALLNG